MKECMIKAIDQILETIDSGSLRLNRANFDQVKELEGLKLKLGNSIVGRNVEYPSRLNLPKPILYIKPKESSTQIRRESRRIILTDDDNEKKNLSPKRVIFQKRRSESTKSLRIVR